eukprot:COSAG06_NODE_4974_length_3817_cov_1.671329_3_plen_156_part_00
MEEGVRKQSFAYGAQLTRAAKRLLRLLHTIDTCQVLSRQDKARPLIIERFEFTFAIKSSAFWPVMREAKHHLSDLSFLSPCVWCGAFGRTEGHAVPDVHTRVVGVRTHAFFMQDERLAAAPGTSHQFGELPSRLHGPATTQTDRQTGSHTDAQTY